MSSLPFLIFIYFIEAFIVYSYTKFLYKSKVHNVFTFCIVSFLYLLLLLIFKFIYSNAILNTVLIIAVNISIIYFMYKSSLKSAIFHGFALGITQFMAEIFISYVTALILKTTSEESVASHFELGAIASMILYFLLSRLLLRFSIKENNSHNWGKWFSLSLLPIGSIFVTIVLKIITDSIILKTYQYILVITSISFLLLINIIVYYIYEKAEENNQKLIELEIVNQKNDIDMQYLNLIEKKNETMNVMAHDYKNHMIAISNMSNQIEIKNYIDNMLGEITKYNQIGKTKNRLLDVILSKYIDICNDKGIKFETCIMTDNLSFINDFDLSTLFNNILDNAVEAASKSTVKFVHLEIANSLNSYHKTTVINSCDTAPQSIKDNLITTKKNKVAHGFGTKSIQRIVKKYNGELQWEYNKEEKQFKLIILFPESKIV